MQFAGPSSCSGAAGNPARAASEEISTPERLWQHLCEASQAELSMQELPHRYVVAAAAGAEGDVELSAAGLPALASAPPAEFGGSGDRWSPETLLAAAVADCFVLTFRGTARASRLPWTSLRCDVIGTLDRVEKVTQFTRFDIRVSLVIPPAADAQLAQRVLEKAERNCLIVNSLKAASHLEARIVVVGEPAHASA
jgi:organic hydroperoxide reductase OsmC/OhrA